MSGGSEIDGKLKLICDCYGGEDGDEEGGLHQCVSILII